MKRLVLRLLLAGVACFALFVLCVGTAVTLALWSPSFYSDLAAHQVDPAAAQAAEQRFNQLRDDYLRWRAASLRPPRDQPTPPNNDVIAALLAAPPVDQRPSPTHTIRVSEADINVLLAADPPRAGQASAPLIRLVGGRVLVGFALDTPAGDLVLSAGFAPQPVGANDNEVRMQIDSARLGRLPLPLTALVGLLPKEISRLQGNLYLDTTGSLPELALRMDQATQPTPLPQSLEIADGELIVKLSAPPTL